MTGRIKEKRYGETARNIIGSRRVRMSLSLSCLLLFHTITSNGLHAQSAGISYSRGSFLTTSPKAEYVREGYTSLGEFFLQFRTKGDKDWHHSHNLPSWGMALTYGNTGSERYIGKLTALSMFIDVPLIRSRYYTGSVRAGAGPAYVSKPYDIYTNPKNTLIGTHLNAFIHLAFRNEWRISHSLCLNADLGFIHVSNGGTTLPNLGLNIPSFTIGTRSTLKKESVTYAREPATFQRETYYRLQATAALKQASRVGGNHYLINVVQAEAGRRTRRNHYFGAGLMYSYNRSLDFKPSETPLNPVKKHKSQLGLYGSYEHFFGRLSFPIQVGFYLYNKDQYTTIFQQYGVRFSFNRHWNAVIMLKSHGGQADVIHVGGGYTF